MPIEIEVNGTPHTIDAEPDTPLLWILRDILKLKGTKFGCGVSECGACTVHLDGMAIRSCTFPIEAVGDASVTTIEGLAQTEHAILQQAWVDEQVPQCGYCQPGMIMATAAALSENPEMTDEEIKSQITNICRCGTYGRVLKAIRAVIEKKHATQ
jgi:isoquinoline 1-oxidoreductase alpha subunit